MPEVHIESVNAWHCHEIWGDAVKMLYTLTEARPHCYPMAHLSRKAGHNTLVSSVLTLEPSGDTDLPRSVSMPFPIQETALGLRY